MAAPSYTYTLTNGTTADASQVMQNFNDILNGVTDGTKDLSISALTVAGTATFNGNCNFGNASGDDMTFTGSLASSLPIKTTNAFDIGGATLGLAGVYFGNAGSSRTLRLVSAAAIATASRTYTMPDAGANANFLMSESAQTVNGVINFANGIQVAGNETLATYNEDTSFTAVATPVTSGSYTHSKQKVDMIQVGKLVKLSIDISTSGSSTPTGIFSIVVSGAPRADVTNIAMYSGEIVYDGVSTSTENIAVGLDDTGSQVTLFIYHCGFGGGNVATKITTGEINPSVFHARISVMYKAQ